MKKFLLPAFFLTWLLVAPHAQAQTNVVANPGFELGETDWNFWGGTVQSGIRRTGAQALRVSLSSPTWSGADQIIALPPGTFKAKVSGWMKTEAVVQGNQGYETARIAVEFLDNNNQMVGGYPPVTGQRVGTQDWELVTKEYVIPDLATKIKIQAVIGNCVGTAWFDDLSVELSDADGNALQRKSIAGPESEGKWYALSDFNNLAGHYVDWSSLLDAPAGKHGFVKSANGHLQFENGKPARFWGVNMVAANCFLSHGEADSVALRLARMGCNLVRLHHMDAPWSKPNIFGNASNTRQLSKESLEKLDYLIAALKKKGIYIFLDLLVHRDFMVSDGVSNRPPDLGGKQIGYFDSTLIRLQKEYIQQLLSHKNTYTKLAYKDEPAIIASEFINEASAFLHFGGDILTPAFRHQLQQKFQQQFPGKKLSVFDLNYEKFFAACMKEKQAGDLHESMQFLSQTEREYYREMSQFMRKMGVQYPLSGSNFPNPILIYQFDNLETELITANDYWDHPQLWKTGNDWSRVLYAPLNNTSMYKNPERSVIANIMRFRWNHKPFIVTEFNACYPNEYRLESVPFIASYAALQDVDGMIQFDFEKHALAHVPLTNIAISKMPEYMAAWVVAAPIFHKQYVKPAPGRVHDRVTEKQALQLPSYSDFLDKNFHLSFITRVGKLPADSSQQAQQASDFDSFFNKETGIITSETKELSLDTKQGIFRIQTDFVQGISGAIKDQEFSFPVFRVQVKNSWAAVYLISADNLPLNQSKKMYLVVLCPVKNTAQQFNESRNALLEPGTTPVMAQVAEGDFVFKTTAKKISVLELDHSGNKRKKLNVLFKSDGLGIKLQEGRSFVYEVSY
ncbi:MAG: carbohydrate binding domain-containing protein [Cytophagaceae bacterium]|jgi:hypothetical protein|nr:carbohydrate binding domain-containing protein [Cytophagaceae bacterium]